MGQDVIRGLLVQTVGQIDPGAENAQNKGGADGFALPDVLMMTAAAMPIIQRTVPAKIQICMGLTLAAGVAAGRLLLMKVSAELIPVLIWGWAA